MSRLSPSPRDRRLWTKDEDAILRREVEMQAEREGSATDWCAIATELPSRTNKDCRKRWSKISGGVSKGPWSDAEDDRLRRAVAACGPRWTEVAKSVQSRNADQCSKRWLHFLDPRLDRGKWSLEDDGRLLRAVQEFGTDWKRMCDAYFPQRSPTNVKNRYNNIKQRMRLDTRSQDRAPSATLDSASTSSPDSSLADMQSPWSLSEPSSAGYQPMLSHPGGLQPPHGHSSHEQSFQTWTSQEDQFEQNSRYGSAEPSQATMYPGMRDLQLSDHDVNVLWSGQSSSQTLAYDGRGGSSQNSVYADNLALETPQFVLPSSSVNSFQQQHHGGRVEDIATNDLRRGASFSAPSWPESATSATAVMSGAGQSMQSGVAQYGLIIDDVPPETVHKLVGFLSNSDLQYTLHRESTSPGPNEGSTSRRRSVNTSAETAGQLGPGARYSVGVEKLSLPALQRLMEALNASELRGHTHVTA